MYLGTTHKQLSLPSLPRIRNDSVIHASGKKLLSILFLLLYPLLQPILAVAESKSDSRDGSVNISPDLVKSIRSANQSTLFKVIIQVPQLEECSSLNKIQAKNSSDSIFSFSSSFTPLNTSGTFTAMLTAKQINVLANKMETVHISIDLPVNSCQDYVVSTVSADQAWAKYGVTGKKIGIAVLDTGLMLHPDLLSSGGRVSAWIDFVNHKMMPYDDNGHGTHVAGIAAGDGYTAAQYHYNTSIKFVAPQSQIIAVKVLDQYGAGNVSTVIAGIDWCIANKAHYNIRVLNLSLGHPITESYKTDPLCLACERALNAGIVVICAAGNMGRSVPNDPESPTQYGTILSPANDPGVITVGALNTMGTQTTSDDTVTTYSSRGPSMIDLVLKPDIIAPGNHVTSLAAPASLLFTNYAGNRILPSQYSGIGPVAYFELSGTSMAAPVVAGAAALMIQAQYSISPAVVKARMMTSATKIPTQNPLSIGAGELNIMAAIASRIGAPSGAASPTTYLSADGYVNISFPVRNGNVIWGNNVIWGDNFRACHAIYGSVKWSGNVIWGNGLWNGDVFDTGSISINDQALIMLEGE